MSAPLSLHPAAALPLALLAKATLLLAAAWLATRLLAARRASAAARHLVWTLAVAGLLALPFLSLALPGWRLGMVRVAGAPPSAESPASSALAPASSPSPASLVSGDERRGTPIAYAASQPVPVAADEGFLAGLDLPRTLLAVYLLGVAALLAWVGAGWWAVARMARRSEAVADPAWTGLLRDLAWMLDVDRPVALLRSERVSMPMACGIRNPVVILPAAADEWPEERRRVVLLHELAHVARRDCLTQLLAAVACALYWPHPGAWYAARRLRVERELACDDRVLGAGTRAREYAAHLLEVARAYAGPALSASVAVSMARPSQLEGRLLAVLDQVRSRRGMNRAAWAGASLAALALVLPLASMRPAQAAPAAKADPVFAAHSLPMDAVGQGAYERAVAARSGGRLRLSFAASPRVSIVGWDRDEVRVRSWAGPSGGDARVDVRGSGESVMVSCLDETSEDARLEIRVPRRFSVDLATEGGRVEIRDVSGRFTGSTGGGALAFTDAGGSVRITTAGGPASISTSALAGRLELAGGVVRLGRNRGQLDITGGSDTVIADEAWKTEAQAAAEAQAAGEAEAEAEASAGADAGADVGEVWIDTSSGDGAGVTVRSGTTAGRARGTSSSSRSSSPSLRSLANTIVNCDDDGCEVNGVEVSLRDIGASVQLGGERFEVTLADLVGDGDKSRSGFVSYSGDPDGRIASARAVARNAPHDAAAQSLTALAFADPVERVQLAAVSSLAGLPRSYSAEGLARISERHPRADVRRAARRALGR